MHYCLPGAIKNYDVFCAPFESRALPSKARLSGRTAIVMIFFSPPAGGILFGNDAIVPRKNYDY